jgi:hypothetical protein
MPMVGLLERCSRILLGFRIGDNAYRQRDLAERSLTMTNTTPPNTPTFKNAYEYAERWRTKHDAIWVANEVWNKVHGPNGYGSVPWQGFSVEDYRLTADEAAIYQYKIDTIKVNGIWDMLKRNSGLSVEAFRLNPQETAIYQAKVDAEKRAKQEAIEWKEKREREAKAAEENKRLAKETRQKEEAALVQSFRDKGVSTLKVEAMVRNCKLPGVYGISRDGARGTSDANNDRLSSAADRIESCLEKLGFTRVMMNHWDDYETDIIDAHVTYEATLNLPITDDLNVEAVASELLKEKMYSLLSRRKMFDGITECESIEFKEDAFGYDIIVPELVAA